MKVLSPRVSIISKPDLLSVVILPTTDRRKLGLMFLWLLAWTVCGLIVLANYFRIPDERARLFLIVYLAFWAYFEFNILRTFIWKRFGREKLWIRNGTVHYQREVHGRGKVREYDAALVTPAEVLEMKPASLAGAFYESFWVKGGERVVFSIHGKTIRLGMQLSDEEAATVARDFNAFLKG